jgi:hypothetical protein
MIHEESLRIIRDRQREALKSIDENLEFGDVIGLLIAVKQEQKQISSLRAAASAPYQEMLLKIRGDFGDIEKASTEAEDELKKRVLAQNRLHEQKRQDAMRLADEEHARGNMEAVRDALLLASEASLELPPEISLRRQLKYEVVEKSTVPIQYLKIDDAKLRAALNEDKGEFGIPGVKTFYETIVAVRAEDPNEE